jgi:hypothetical protein
VTYTPGGLHSLFGTLLVTQYRLIFVAYHTHRGLARGPAPVEPIELGRFEQVHVPLLQIVTIAQDAEDPSTITVTCKHQRRCRFSIDASDRQVQVGGAVLQNRQEKPAVACCRMR